MAKSHKKKRPVEQYGADDAIMIQLCLNCKRKSCIDCIGRISSGTKKAVRKEIEQGSIPFVVPEN